MPRPSRFSEIAPLPPHGTWRRVLALDRGAGSPRPVALAFVPQAVLDDPARLAAVARDVEVAGRLHHPGVVAVLGLETVGDAPAIVEAHASGVTLRELLDACGRLPPDLAARIALDACAAAARAHALDAGDGRGLVHGAIAPSRIVVGEDGASRLSGFGAAGAGGDPAADVRALGAVLHECLAGEPAAAPPRPLDAPGIPAPLAAVVAAATGATPGAPPSAASLAQAVAGAGAVASHAEVAAYAEAVLPRERASLERALASASFEGAEEVSAELIADPAEAARAAAAPEPPPRAPAPPAGGEATPEPLPRPPATRPGADPVGVFAAPRPAARRSRAPLAAAVVCLAAGFAGGFVAARRSGLVLSFAAAPAPIAEDAAADARRGASAHVATAPAPVAAPARQGEGAAPPAAPPAAPRAAKPARTTTTATTAKPRRDARAAAPAQPAPTGLLDVRAPPEADVFLDGRRIGRGGLRRDVTAGAHLIEVRLGAARVEERFEVAPGETWTYEVTPAP